MPFMQSEVMNRTGEIVHILFIVDVSVIVSMAMSVLAVIPRIARFIANTTHINSHVFSLIQKREVIIRTTFRSIDSSHCQMD